MFRALAGMLRGLALLVALLIPVVTSAAPAPQPSFSPGATAQAGYVVVRFRDGVDAAAVARLLTQYPPLRQMGGIYRLSAPAGEEATVAAHLNADPAVEYAFVNREMALKVPSLVTAGHTPPIAKPVPVSAANSADAEAPALAAATNQPTITDFWLSDERIGNMPLSRTTIWTRCGVRFNAKNPVYANIRYQNMQQGLQIRAELHYRGPYLNDDQLVGTRSYTSLTTLGAAAIPLDVYNQPVGCYEVRLVAESAVQTPSVVSIPFQIVTAPQDNKFPYDLWQLDHTRSTEGTPEADVKATGAWNITTGSNITIAVVGTGVEANHPEFAGRLVSGWNLVDNDANTDDDYGYGTFLTGLLAANTRNQNALCDQRCSMAGVNWGAKIMPIKVGKTAYTPEGVGVDATAEGMVAGIHRAYTLGARVILVTLSIDPNTTEEIRRALLTEIGMANQRGVVVVAPVGERYDGANRRYLPAALSGVIAVTATTKDDQHWDTANTGSHVRIAAPGRTYIYSTNIPGSPWYPQSTTDPTEADGDTAFAAAQVAGIVGLMLSVNPTLTPAQVQDILERTADKVDSDNVAYTDCDGDKCRNDNLGYGRVNAENALLATPHYLDRASVDNPDGALKTEDFPILTAAGQYCKPLKNFRTGAVTWRVQVAAGDDRWVEVRGPYSARGTAANPDYQGDLPSYADVCVTVSPSLGYGVKTAHLTIVSTMPKRDFSPIPIELKVVYAQRLYNVFLPLLNRGQLAPTR